MASTPSISYSITVRLELPAGGPATSELTATVERCGGMVTALDVTASGHDKLTIDVTCAASDTAHADEIVEAFKALEGVVVH
ncbi:MAG TPA: NAD-dependent malic enzyme, partial [Nocardioidaceae bacterium]